MITEDYVSFEIAKLLKEKGFDERICNTCYKLNGKFCNNRKSMSGVDNMICYQAPTLQMAIKWIRVKGYQIIVKHTDNNGYFANILTMDDAHPVNKLFDGYKVYEQACEAAIKYCLKFLI